MKLYFNDLPYDSRSDLLSLERFAEWIHLPLPDVEIAADLRELPLVSVRGTTFVNVTRYRAALIALGKSPGRQVKDSNPDQSDRKRRFKTARNV